MTLPIRKALIVYFSPAGSTEHVAQVMEEKIRSSATPVITIHLGREPDVPFILSQLPAARDNLCLYIGSPVYVCHAAPPVMAFIAGLPAAKEGYAVPFVTWGGVTSGVALHEMGRALEEKGYAVLGAAKILARHSLMWDCSEALGENHPDQGDDRMVATLLEEIDRKLRGGEPAGLPLSLLDYQPRGIRGELASTGLEAVRDHLPAREVDMEICSQCGVCVDQCPVQAITLLPHPRFGPACIGCFNCVRLCPDGAIKADLSGRHARIREMAERLDERPLSRIFV